MAETPNHYIAILCGGTGPRLWPLSRADFPKQFLKLLSNKSLLQSTYDRALKIVPKNRIYIVTNSRFANQIKNQLPHIPPSQILSEPEKKNTALAILYVTSLINLHDPNSIITTLPSDHHISDIKKFSKSIKTSVEFSAKNQKITLIGKTPEYPNPSFGYIVPKESFHQYFSVRKFVEKPKLPLLTKLIKDGALWNLGIYTFSPQVLFDQFRQYQKDKFSLYNLIITRPDVQTVVSKVYSQAENLPIDTAISEKSTNLQAISANFDWSDIGEWGSIFKQLPKTQNNIKSVSQTTLSYSQNSNNCLLSADPEKLIGLVGVSNLAIIDTSDALLVCNLDDSLQVRDLISQIVSKKNTQNYFLKTNAPKSTN